MPSSRRNWLRSLAWAGVLPGVLLVATLGYMLGMQAFEGEARDFWQSFAWASETLTTTGYGHDSQWRHPLMILFVTLIQFSGLFLVYLLFPIFVIPYFERRFESRLPRQVPEGVEAHVLVYGYGPAVASLLEDMRRVDIPNVLLEPDESVARRVRDRGIGVVQSSLEEADPFAGGLSRARALVLNGSDQDDAALVLTARQQGFTGPIHVLVGDPKHRRPMVLAGATAAYSPKHALAAALAAKASPRVSPRIAGLQQIGERLEVGQLRIQRESPLVGKTLREAHVRERTGATVVGEWIGGRFELELGAETVLRERAILVAVGSSEALRRLGELATSLDRKGPFFVLGCGEVGQKVREMLRDAGEETVVIDRVQRPGVDRLADALEPSDLEAAGVRNAQAAVLALSTDSTNLFAAAILHDLVPDLPIIARVNRAEEVERIHAAGADFALSISQVASQLLGRQLFGEEFVSLEPEIRLARARAAHFEGLAPISPSIRERTGCFIVALERAGEILLEFPDDLRIDSEDLLYLCGSHESIARFFELHPEGRLGGGDAPAV